MSNSSDSFQLMKEDENEIKIKNSSPPISNYSDGYPKVVSNQNLDQVQENQEQQGGNSNDNDNNNNNNNILEQEHEKKRDDNVIEEITAKIKFGKSEVEEDDEGFRTPTSLDQRIPVIPTKCPLAPRKPRPPSPPPSSRKRKISRRRNVVKLDYSREVESLFPPAIQQDLSKKMKKARKGDNDNDGNI